MGLALVLAGLLVSLVVLVLAWLVGGAANAAQRVCMDALVRSRTPDGDRGRTFAAVGAVLQASNLAGLAGGAAVVTLLGARASFLAAGAATVVVGGLTWVLARAALDPARVLTPTGSRAGPAGP
jgi:MFS family permease